jgi:sulfate-transporting ATPase
MNYSEETADEFARVQEQIDIADAWNLDTTLEVAMDALRCPPADADVTSSPAVSVAAWRCAGCC